jgi:glycosyltransferase involved in cell wall biosynthesis
MDNNLITVVTPTFNRANYLPILFNSLKVQTCFDFVWLVIDDGSTDNTREVISKIKEENPPFEVQYEYKKNGGKHTALNLAIEKVDTELFFIVDSDDKLTSDAIETIKNDWESFKHGHPHQQLCGISYLRGYSDIKPIGDRFPEDYLVDSFNDVRVRQHVMGDKAEVWTTEYLKRFRFPVFAGERFLVESWMWVQVSSLAPMLFINKVIYLTEYLEGGLTESGRKLRIRCPQGGMVFSLLMMDRQFPMRDRIKNGLLYIAYSRFAHKPIAQTLRCSYHLLALLSLIPGNLLYLYWNKKYNR